MAELVVMAVRIQLNGESRVIDARTVGGLLTALELPRTKIAVERNMNIVPRSLYDTTALNDGDRIEIVQFVGGG